MCVCVCVREREREGGGRHIPIESARGENQGRLQKNDSGTGLITDCVVVSLRSKTPLYS